MLGKPASTVCALVTWVSSLLVYSKADDINWCNSNALGRASWKLEKGDTDLKEEIDLFFLTEMRGRNRYS